MIALTTAGQLQKNKAAIAAAWAMMRKITVPQLNPLLCVAFIFSINASIVSLGFYLGDRAFCFRRGHDLDFLKLGSLKTKESRHLNDLVFAYEVFGIGTEL